jgi:hypothetical protein
MMDPVNPDANSPRLFDDLPPRNRRPLLVRWWLIAVVAHLALLALPVSWWNREMEPSESLVVELVAPPPAAEAPTAPSAPAPPEPKPALEPDVPPPTPLTLAESPRDPPPEPAVSVTPEPKRPEDTERELEIQRLLEAVAAMDWTTPDASATLGRTTTSEAVDAMRAPLLASTDNAFDGMPAPADTEIVDRWMSPGGVHQVVVRGPDGNTYCGRQEAPNDMRPWLQMPMLFHRCAGGGKRGRGASWRNN